MNETEPSMYSVTLELPSHLRGWQLPPGWSWGTEGLATQHRHYQEIHDALGRSLSLVSASDPSHHAWLEAEARHLAHRNHPAMPTTYHYWATFSESHRGPGYLRRWIAGETVGARLRRMGTDDVPGVMRVLREVGSALSYLHDFGASHGAMSPETVWATPMGRLWIIGWQWAMPQTEIPPGLAPDFQHLPIPSEWSDGKWRPSALSDQWQLAAICFAMLTGETPPSNEVPPLQLLRPDATLSVRTVLDRALNPDPERRYPSIAAMLRAVDRVVGSRTMVMLSGDEPALSLSNESAEVRLRWALGDDYEVLAALGSGAFGSVWRVRDLTLGREVALKLLHPHVARDERIVGRFRREAKLAAMLAHPAIVPIFDWDSRGDVAWYTMELTEGGSVAELVARSGPRSLTEVAHQIDFILNGLAAAHAVGIIHRDLKPENVLIDRYRRWRLADFGIANMTGEEASGASGTPAFAPPEQLLGEQQDATADCFSIAAIVAFVLTGTAPFGERDSASILARELKGDVDLSGYAPEIAEWLRRGLSASPDDRFTDASAMQAAWREAVQIVLERDRQVPWWRRWFAPDGTGAAWAGDSVFTPE
jgi:eukaryotic-like serine/threonine-protein kinase